MVCEGGLFLAKYLKRDFTSRRVKQKLGPETTSVCHSKFRGLIPTQATQIFTPQPRWPHKTAGWDDLAETLVRVKRLILLEMKTPFGGGVTPLLWKGIMEVQLPWIKSNHYGWKWAQCQPKLCKSWTQKYAPAWFGPIRTKYSTASILSSWRLSISSGRVFFSCCTMLVRSKSGFRKCNEHPFSAGCLSRLVLFFCMFVRCLSVLWDPQLAPYTWRKTNTLTA